MKDDESDEREGPNPDPEDEKLESLAGNGFGEPRRRRAR